MTKKNQLPRLISTADAAKLIGVTNRCVLQMIADGRLTAHRLGIRTWQIERKSAEETKQNPAKVGRPRNSLAK